ncbi:hypothetical protein RISK_001578 [Rhodopirellula islandica]|uniref:Uncharacterized protein n=1 Tax=Rhodopirellula islandica TaxID=595434 RepID=A0A0J1BIJ5_RHOIS|nr:hypothetical protein RISK_001578 [Rhodopirellula islandica]
MKNRDASGIVLTQRRQGAETHGIARGRTRFGGFDRSGIERVF